MYVWMYTVYRYGCKVLAISYIIIIDQDEGGMDDGCDGDEGEDVDDGDWEGSQSIVGYCYDSRYTSLLESKYDIEYSSSSCQSASNSNGNHPYS